MGSEHLPQLVDRQTMQFFDPFAPEGDQAFDPLASLEATFARYRADKVGGETGALDTLIVKVQSLFMDAHFVGRFAELQAMAAQVHAMCGEDHAALQRFGMDGYLLPMAAGDRPGRSEHDHAGHDHTDDDDDEKEEKKDSKNQSKPRRSTHIGRLALHHKY